MSTLYINDLHTEIDGKAILKGVTLTINPGEVHCIMGPNGSGKSTLANTLMGHPKYRVTSGTIRFGELDVTHLSPTERAKAGMFLAFQYPKEIPGITLAGFVRAAYNAQMAARAPETRRLSVFHAKRVIKEQLKEFVMKEEFAERYVNDGFSGGEKKKAEILQMAILKPKLAILDETDSGLDIDALRIVCEQVNKARATAPTPADAPSLLLITHYQRILQYLRPDVVHVLVDGQIVKSGDMQLVEQLEKEGYEAVRT